MKGRRVQLFKGRDGCWYFHVRNANGKVTNPSQGYSSRRAARRRLLQEHGDTPVEVLDS